MHRADIVVFPMSKRHALISRVAEVLVNRQDKNLCDKYWKKVIDHEYFQLKKLGVNQRVIRDQVGEFKITVESKINLMTNLQGKYKK